MNGKKTRIAVFPYPNEFNPYIHLLYKNIQKESNQFTFFKFRKALFLLTTRRAHIHWPEYFLREDSLLESTLFMILLTLYKVIGGKIIITLHNRYPHGEKNWVEKLYLKIIYSYANGFIRLDQAEEAITDAEKNKPVVHIPHGHYLQAYPNQLSKEEARKKLNLSDEDRVALFFGRVRRYKNIETLLEVFREKELQSTKLFIVGKADQDYLAELKRDANSIFVDQFVPSQDVQIYFNSCDYVIALYKQDILNSGTLLLALTFNKPIILPETKEFIALREEFTSDFIKLYRSTEEIPSLIASILNEKITRKCSFEKRSWDKIAQDHVKFYEQIF